MKKACIAAKVILFIMMAVLLYDNIKKKEEILYYQDQIIKLNNKYNTVIDSCEAIRDTNKVNSLKTKGSYDFKEKSL